jgi:glycosyltransferase involved in cell wall biosynthesis
MPRVHQVLASLGYGDAIGNLVLGIRRVLVAAGFDSEIIVETADPRLEHLTVDYRDLAAEIAPDDLLIHHFSLGSRASRTAFAVPSRMILTYHNITPPQYFLGEHPWLVRQCYHGRRELAAYRSRVDLALGASEFNRRELEALGFSPTAVLPVVADFSHLDVRPDPRIHDAYDDETINVLFVGRLIPNKRPDNLIRYVHAYRRAFGARARLILAGSHDQFGGYLAELHAFAARLGAEDVHILGQVSNEELTALYDVADVFLCASEHEGFCVPIVEAFHKRVPVLAFASTAVPATMDGGGLLFETTDPVEVAGLLDAVVSDAVLEERILAAQDAALARLRARNFDGLVLDYARQALAAPRRPPMPVAADFWQQFQLAEELEAIREARPSAFHALPAAPAAPRTLADVGSRA